MDLQCLRNLSSDLEFFVRFEHRISTDVRGNRVVCLHEADRGAHHEIGSGRRAAVWLLRVGRVAAGQLLEKRGDVKRFLVNVGKDDVSDTPACDTFTGGIQRGQDTDAGGQVRVKNVHRCQRMVS